MSYRFFSNSSCEYFPCHRTNDPERFNCLFCYCPLYTYRDCGGSFELLPGRVKDCTGCLKPHYDYDWIQERLAHYYERAASEEGRE